MNTKIHNPADDQAKLKPKSPNKSATHPDSASPNDLRNQDEKCSLRQACCFNGRIAA